MKQRLSYLGITSAVMDGGRLNDLKLGVHALEPSNLTELEMFRKEEWSKIPSSRIQTLITGYRKRLVAVISSKRGLS